MYQLQICSILHLFSIIILNSRYVRESITQTKLSHFPFLLILDSLILIFLYEFYIKIEIAGALDLKSMK